MFTFDLNGHIFHILGVCKLFTKNSDDKLKQKFVFFRIYLKLFENIFTKLLSFAPQLLWLIEVLRKITKPEENYSRFSYGVREIFGVKTRPIANTFGRNTVN